MGQVKSYTRRTKSGKTVTVSSHTRGTGKGSGKMTGKKRSAYNQAASRRAFEERPKMSVGEALSRSKFTRAGGIRAFLRGGDVSGLKSAFRRNS